MSELRALFPIHIIRGGLLRSDGSAVGLVHGGAPSWDLLSIAERAQAGGDYHRLLLALNAPIDVYLVDQPPDVAGEIAALLSRQAQASSPLLADVLGEIADYLIDPTQQQGGRAKQVIWVVTAGIESSGRSGLDVSGLVRRGVQRQRIVPSPAECSALAQAVEQARRLADAIQQLGGRPVPRLLEAEEIAHLIYTLADPIRAQRYPLVGALLERVRRIVTPSASIGQGLYAHGGGR